MAKKKADDSEARPPKVLKMVLWTILSDERRKLGRAAGPQRWVRGTQTELRQGGSLTEEVIK